MEQKTTINVLKTISAPATEIGSEKKYPKLSFSMVEVDWFPGKMEIKGAEEEYIGFGLSLQIEIEGQIPVVVNGKFVISKLLPMINQYLKKEQD
jgi:hypothetical protein